MTAFVEGSIEETRLRKRRQNMSQKRTSNGTDLHVFQMKLLFFRQCRIKYEIKKLIWTEKLTDLVIQQWFLFLLMSFLHKQDEFLHWTSSALHFSFFRKLTQLWSLSALAKCRFSASTGRKFNARSVPTYLEIFICTYLRTYKEHDTPLTRARGTRSTKKWVILP